MKVESRNYGTGCMIQLVALVLIALGIMFALLPDAESHSDEITYRGGTIVAVIFVAAGAFVFYMGFKSARKN